MSKDHIAAQKKLCKEKRWPEFFPSHTGNCFDCNQNIFSDGFGVKRGAGQRILSLDKNRPTKGKTLKSASEYLITGCPHCNRSYCD